MIVNLWSTPRTGSNWYSQYLYQEYKSTDRRTKLYTQFLNKFHFINYNKPRHGDFVYTFESNCNYLYYYYDPITKSISSRYKQETRTLDTIQEEIYRLGLLEKHDHNKNPSIFYSHVEPMSEKSYKKLYDMADENVFIYRKNIRNQLSSYALGFSTKQFKVSKKIYENLHVEVDILKNLADRIIKWYSLDKTGAKIVCYEDLDFASKGNMPKKQNHVDPFIQLDNETQQNILVLEDYCNSIIQKMI